MKKLIKKIVTTSLKPSTVLHREIKVNIRWDPESLKKVSKSQTFDLERCSKAKDLQDTVTGTNHTWSHRAGMDDVSRAPKIYLIYTLMA